MNITEFKESIDYMFKAQLTPFVWGEAGVGKSSIVKQYAKDKGYYFFPFYLGTQSDLGDILGLADFVRDENGTAIATTFAIPDWLRKTITYCNENPESGAVIFLDEFNRARRDILNGMFSLALDKTFHTLRLPRNCHVIAAGNPPTDGYITTDIDETALMSRFVHIKLEPTVEEWVSYASVKNINPNLIGFIRAQPALLNSNKSTYNLPVKPDPRAYERLDSLLKTGVPDHLVEQLMFGIIGLERTIAYQNYLKETEQPLSGDEVLRGEKKDLLSKWSTLDNLQASYLNLTTENLLITLGDREQTHNYLNGKEKENFMYFLTTVPKDISWPLFKSCVDKQYKIFKDFYETREYKDAAITLLKQMMSKKS
jgi:hypothetical protein